jgi:magnesium transporter
MASSAIHPPDRSGMVVNSVAYVGGRRVADVPIEDISEVVKTPDQFIWVGLHEPDARLLGKMQEELGLHELAVEDALRAHQRPKLEDYGEDLFLVLRTAQLVGEQIVFGETHVFAGRRYVVTVRHGASFSYAAVRARCESRPELLAKGTGFVLYAILDFVVDNYFPIVDALEDHLQKLEEQIFRETFDRGATARIYALKRDLVSLKRAVAPLMEVCNRLMRFDCPVVPDDVRVYFRDIYDHVIRINESVDNLRELLTTALEASLALISVGQNEVTKKLAAWAAILAVPTAIAGIYGMNFDTMPELRWTFGYPAVLGGIGLACGVLYWRFKRAEWL